jgi:hypothetical protein
MKKQILLKKILEKEMNLLPEMLEKLILDIIRIL